jgi:hypothetical protein
MCEKCAVTPAVIGRAAGRKAQREHDAKVAADAVKAFTAGQPQPSQFDKATRTAQKVLAGVGVVVLLASVNFIEHVVLITLAVVFALVCSAAVTVAVRRRRRLRTTIPAPLPSAPARTTVTGITVRALPASSPRSPQTAARELTGTPVKVRRGT